MGPPSLLLASLFFALAHSKNQEAANCCMKAGGSCRRSCQQYYLAKGSPNPEIEQQTSLDFRNFCSPLVTSLWKCLNETERNSDEERHHGLLGRNCCKLAQTEKCRRACISAKHELSHHCRHSDEMALLTCVEKQQMAEECCGIARNSECHSACRQYLTYGSKYKSTFHETCGHYVIHCIHNITKPSPITNGHKYLHCCERATDPKCKETCKRSFRTRQTDQEIMEELQEGGCQPVSLHDKLWQCFMIDDQSKSTRDKDQTSIGKIGIDAAKLYCCLKGGITSKCKNLCLTTFSNDYHFDYWVNFDNTCLRPVDEELGQCFAEVEEPCELGCEGLKYCDNFNNRPTELFRSCNPDADSAAKGDLKFWMENGFINITSNLRIYLKNISQCSPEHWKAVACILQIKPCHEGTHTNKICSLDCFNLLQTCVDKEKMTESRNHLSNKEICNIITTQDLSAACIPLDTYLKPNKKKNEDEVTRPCNTNANTCAASHICLINRTCQSKEHCEDYYCSPGCRVGTTSQLIVPSWTYVRIPIPSGQRNHHQVCLCTLQGTLSGCQSVKSISEEICRVNEETKMHGSTYYVENCTFCICHNGEVICNIKQCMDSANGKNRKLTTHPCNCELHFVQVCGSNGMTYPSACLAECFGLTEKNLAPGSCQAKDPCSPNPCSASSKCIPRRRVCLMQDQTDCPQHVCVNTMVSCQHQPVDYVCDVNGRQYYNLCNLEKNHSELGYLGPCMDYCKTEGEVCGIDGNTYPSECSALSRMISVDYEGPCKAVGLISDEPKVQCSDQVKCPELAQKECLGFTPPGACCPICTGAIKMLYSHKQVYRTFVALGGQRIEPFTVEAVLQSLQRHVQVKECAVRGMLTIQADILVLVTPIKKNPSELQLEACRREAEKLVILVQRGSPTIVSELSLSFLTAATKVHTTTSSANGIILNKVKPYELVLAILVSSFTLGRMH